MKVMELIELLGNAAFGGASTLETQVTVIDNTTGQEFDILEVVDQYEPKGVTLRIMGPLG